MSVTDPIGEIEVLFRPGIMPGKSCAARILELLSAARTSVDLCIYTISDDRIRDKLIGILKKGVTIRIISDQQTTSDRGSDVLALAGAGASLRLETKNSRRMHHKFAILDDRMLMTGSYNWTKGASDSNYENLMVSAHPPLVRPFVEEFERLWIRFQSPPANPASIRG